MLEQRAKQSWMQLLSWRTHVLLFGSKALKPLNQNLRFFFLLQHEVSSFAKQIRIIRDLIVTIIFLSFDTCYNIDINFMFLVWTYRHTQPIQNNEQKIQKRILRESRASVCLLRVPLKSYWSKRAKVKCSVWFSTV